MVLILPFGCGIFFAVGFLLGNDHFRRDMVVFLSAVNAVAVFFSQGTQSFHLGWFTNSIVYKGKNKDGDLQHF